MFVEHEMDGPKTHINIAIKVICISLGDFVSIIIKINKLSLKISSTNFALLYRFLLITNPYKVYVRFKSESPLYGRVDISPCTPL